MITLRKVTALRTCLVFSLFYGCWSEVQPVADSGAVEIWRAHYSVMNKAVTEGQYDGDKFLQSVRFFDRVTGVGIRYDLGYIGPMVTPHTAEDLQRLDAWFSANSGYLKWDPAEGTLRDRRNPSLVLWRKPEKPADGLQ